MEWRSSGIGQGLIKGIWECGIQRLDNRMNEAILNLKQDILKGGTGNITCYK
jgi:hypothetical protein